MVGTSISPSATVQSMLKYRSVLFCAEGNASLARCCLLPLVQCIRPEQCEFPVPRRFSPRWGSIESYATLQQRAAEDLIPPQDAADEWAMAWPTTMPSIVNIHRFCGCQRSIPPAQPGETIWNNDVRMSPYQQILERIG